MEWLQKRTPGTPLSEAEHEQRRQAARARWAAGIGAAVGGAAGGALGAQLGQRRGTARDARALADITPSSHGVIEAAAKRAALLHQLRRDRIDAAVAARQKAAGRSFSHVAESELEPRAVAGGSVLPFNPKLNPVTLRVRQIRRVLSSIPAAAAEIDAKLARNEQDFHLSGREERELRLRRSQLEQHAQPLRDELAHLKQAVPPRGVLRGEHTATRQQATGSRAVLPANARDTAFNRAKTVDVPVRYNQGTSWTVSSHRAKPSHRSISSKGMAHLRDELRQEAHAIGLRLKRHASTVQLAQDQRRGLAEALADARRSFRPQARRFRLAGGLAGALAGAGVAAAGGYALSKAAPSDADPSDQLMASGQQAERDTADRLARVFRSWKDELTPRLMGSAPPNLRSALQSDLSYALRPLHTATVAGAAVQPLTTGSLADRPRQIAFSFSVRNPLVEQYLRRFWDNKIAELTDEQMTTVKETLLEAAKRGLPPAAMAMRVRQSIGLTSSQAGSVSRYRDELESLSPAAVQRELRDRRYDATVNRAIAAGKPLLAPRIDAMVEAYHRRYLAYRAMTIARTEGVGAANNGHMAAVQDVLDRNPAMTVVKRWIATLDERTRPDHRGLHDQVAVGLDTPFIAPSGDLIRWPGDQQAPARAVINCRCSISTMLVPQRMAAQFRTDQFRTDQFRTDQFRADAGQDE